MQHFHYKNSWKWYTAVSNVFSFYFTCVFFFLFDFCDRVSRSVFNWIGEYHHENLLTFPIHFHRHWSLRCDEMICHQIGRKQRKTCFSFLALNFYFQMMRNHKVFCLFFFFHEIITHTHALKQKLGFENWQLILHLNNLKCLNFRIIVRRYRSKTENWKLTAKNVIIYKANHVYLKKEKKRSRTQRPVDLNSHSLQPHGIQSTHIVFDAYTNIFS